MAALVGGEWLDYAVWRPGRPNGVGDVHRGRVVAVVPGMAGAFVAIPEAEGFLPDSAGAAGLGVGDGVTVRIVRAALGGKGPRLAATDLPVGAGPNPVQRLAALHGGPVIVDDQAMANALRPSLGGSIQVGPVLDDDFAALIDALAQPTAELPGGMRASFYPTPALVAIDLDIAGGTSGTMAKQRSQAGLNAAALPALARQIRLRSLSGAILVDLAGLSIKRRAALAEPLRAALAPDPLRPRLLGFTMLGLAEIVRPRVHAPLHEVLAGPHAAGLAALRLVAQANPANPPSLRAAPGVVSALAADPVALPALAHRLGQPLVIRSDPGLPPGSALIEEPSRG